MLCLLESLSNPPTPLCCRVVLEVEKFYFAGQDSDGRHKHKDPNVVCI